MYKYLNFFNKKGEYCNFQYDETNDKWIGRIDFGNVSKDLIEDFQLYILEYVYDTGSSIYEYVFPHIDSSYLPGGGGPIGPTGATADSVKITASFDSASPVPEIFIYDFDLTSTSNVLNKAYSMNYSLTYDASETLAPTASAFPNIKETSIVNSSALQINVAFQPSEENGFSSTLYIEDVAGHTIAEIFLYGEGEEEDERLRDLLQSIGHDILPSDSVIFDTTDVNEHNPDFVLLNKKRKEMLLEFSNIFPYVGSYKALINIIKFFGYQNLRMKEYWLNVDSTSVNYGKNRQIDIKDIFTKDANFNDSGLIPSKIYKKTNKFGLFYDITADSGQFDEYGIPIVEDVFTFSPEEILIKIYALKKKLQNYFLPVNAKIVDIIGEAIFYGRYEINVWNDQYRIDAVSLGLKPTFTVLPSREGYITDLRTLGFFGSPIGSDLTIGGVSNILSWRIGLSTSNVVTTGPLDTIQTYRLTVQIPTISTPIIVDTIIKRNSDTGQTVYQPYEVIDLIISNWTTNSYLNSNFTVYQESGNSGIMRIVQKTSSVGDGTIYADWFSNTNPGPATIQYSIPSSAGGTSYSINISTGPSGTFGPSGAPMSYYEDCFLGYFDRMNIPVQSLNDDEGIPVGYPIVLRNDTFNITWDDANVTYNQIDQIDSSYIGQGSNLLYSGFTNSQTILGWTSVSTPVYGTVSNFPYSNYPSQNNYTWENLGYYGYYEMQWIVSKSETDTPAFYYDSGQGKISELNSLPLILPYAGTYKVELYLWDGWNTKSFLINENWITVLMPESDFIGWYQKRELNYTLDTKRYSVQTDYVTQPIEIGTIPNQYLTWDEYTSTWDLPLHPNEAIEMADISYNSLDSIEFYQSIYNPSTNPLIDRYPYTFDLITFLPTWDDLYHLWWDGIGTKITQWEIRGITSPTVDIFVSRGNTIVNLESGLNAYYVDGPTGYTGATGSTSLIGTTVGEIIVSNSNRRTYRWNGTDWAYVIDVIDTYRATGLTGSAKENMIELSRQLNQVMPIDGIEHPYLTDFIYYYNEEYDYAYSLNPYLRAVSKEFEKGGRHKIKSDNLSVDTRSYETVYFGYLGDIPTHFEIYWVDPTGPIGTILFPGMTAPYAIGSTNLTDLADELNGPTAQSYNSISKYQFNLVLGYSGWTGPSGPTSGATEVKIQGIARAFTSPEEATFEFDNIIGTTYGRSLIKNPTWDQIRILKYAQELPLCTVVNFTYDPSKMWGKTNPIWKLTKEGDLAFSDIYYSNRYFSYMFTERGSYTLSLELEDTNGNKQTVTKKEIIKII